MKYNQRRHNRPGLSTAYFACAPDVKGHMKLRLSISVLVAICFLAMYFTQNISAYLLVGNWIAGFTELYWLLYIFGSISLCFVSCIYPKLRNFLLVAIAPLIATLVCKSLSVLFILFFQQLSILPLAMAISGLLLAYSFLALYWQLGADKEQSILIAIIITVSLCPIAYELTEQMVEQPLTSQGSIAPAGLDALTRAAA
ncbi:hypothetical protein MJO52_12195 [Microbulbifer variabilis]|uniref:Uncharacterized protein n=1 Tax=Microbulbifer variabilis TaxID=266805 RepID=A0ABY4V6N9_9GAMM|nr:hypothetical protein [Microbulbifer variabilis]USD19842.1 hypothetical protein MJO52_12195 [Microbulbifer variabilis]